MTSEHIDAPETTGEPADAPPTPPADLVTALLAYIEWNGAIHEDCRCSEDDTCACSTKWINDGVNAAVNYLRSEVAAEQRVVALQRENQELKELRAKHRHEITTQNDVPRSRTNRWAPPMLISAASNEQEFNDAPVEK